MPYRLGFHNPELIYHTDKGADAPRDDWTFVMCVIVDRGVNPRQVVADLNAAERHRWTGAKLPTLHVGDRVTVLIEPLNAELSRSGWQAGTITSIVRGDPADLTGERWHVHVDGDPPNVTVKIDHRRWINRLPDDGMQGGDHRAKSRPVTDRKRED